MFRYQRFNVLRRPYAAVCGTHVDDIMKQYPEAEEQHFQYLCLDVVYAYALLTDGQGGGLSIASHWGPQHRLTLGGLASPYIWGLSIALHYE